MGSLLRYELLSHESQNDNPMSVNLRLDVCRFTHSSFRSSYIKLTSCNLSLCYRSSLSTSTVNQPDPRAQAMRFASTEQGLSIGLRLSEPKNDANMASGVSEIIPRCEGKAYIATDCQRAVAGQLAFIWLGIHITFEWGTFCLRLAISATSGAHCIYCTSFTSRLIKIYH